MALDVWFKSDIQAAILAGVVLTVRANGGRDLDYLRGALDNAEHTATTFMLDWPELVRQARGQLRGDALALLDQLTVTVVQTT
jgi:hypothetical protein